MHGGALASGGPRDGTLLALGLQFQENFSALRSSIPGASPKPPPGRVTIPPVRCESDRKCCLPNCLAECKDPVYGKCGGSRTLSLVQFAPCKGTAVGRLLGPDVLWAPAGFSGVSQALILSIKGGADVIKGRCPDVEAELGVLLLGNVLKKMVLLPAWSGRQKVPGKEDFQEEERLGRNPLPTLVQLILWADQN
ncbi:hypothetical protein NXF25_009892 [Crotalus adamanteus]|uniref:Uncharacterized protein n=1 Tax=Crotalus adamanteus TaxID=8729 RepID=A0AAW1BS93_CROAD